MAAALKLADKAPAPAALRPERIEAAARTATKRIAPLWPLSTFVAVNPFFGWSEKTFAETAATLRRVAHAEMVMPRGYYRQKIASGEISRADLEEAARTAPPEWNAPGTADALVALAAMPEPAERPRHAVATIAEVLDSLAQGDRQVSRTAFMIDEIGKFCASYFDEGQAAWTSPARALPPYAAWRAMAQFDRNPETMGVKRFRRTVAAVPDEPMTAIGFVIDKLGVPDAAIDDYLFRALFDIGGWAAYARRLAFTASLYGNEDRTELELLAIRVVWGYALFKERDDPAFRARWADAMREAARLPQGDAVADDADLAVRLVLHHAAEISYQRRLKERLAGAPIHLAPTPRKPVQAAFCIDVRSEPFRRALESVWPEAETIGFAGFFGFPIEYVPIGQRQPQAQCPVLLTPAFTVEETIRGASDDQRTEALGLRLLRRRAVKAWKAFKLSAVSSFTFVETAGLSYAPKLLSDALRLTRPAPDPRRDGLDPQDAAKLGPTIEPGMTGARRSGFTVQQRIDMAFAVLGAMSMTTDFGRLVLLAGHGSTTVNNPHAAGLDCGACGGHTGEANARVAAEILNDPQVRRGLLERGIAVPPDTWFVGALHDTTTDEVKLYDLEGLPYTHMEDLRRLREKLAAASARARAARAPSLGLTGGDVHKDIAARARDWSQIRPEWGLAGCAAFIAAPRERTRGRDFGGRAFLHSYDWRQDAGFKVLELIMTAPMVVASWINLQYLGSTTDNRAFGCGDKTLHNVVGQHGVLEGNAGDLRTGLPWQSLHDGEKLIHDPLRLNVVIEAPRKAIADVIAAHELVRQLVENEWLHLWVIDSASGAVERW